MKLYMYYIENGMLECYEREAALVTNNMGEKWYHLTEQFPFWNTDKIFHMACNKVLSGNKNHRDKLFVLSESADYKAAIDIFLEYDQKKIEEYQENIQRLEKKKVFLESEIRSLDIQKNHVWLKDVKFSDMTDQGDGIRAMFFDSPISVLQKFAPGAYSGAAGCSICIEYFVDSFPVNGFVNCILISPVKAETGNGTESCDWDEIDLDFKEVEYLIRLAETEMAKKKFLIK